MVTQPIYFSPRQQELRSHFIPPQDGRGFIAFSLLVEIRLPFHFSPRQQGLRNHFISSQAAFTQPFYSETIWAMQPFYFSLRRHGSRSQFFSRGALMPSETAMRVAHAQWHATGSYIQGMWVAFWGKPTRKSKIIHNELPSLSSKTHVVFTWRLPKTAGVSQPFYFSQESKGTKDSSATHRSPLAQPMGL